MKTLFKITGAFMLAGLFASCGQSSNANTNEKKMAPKKPRMEVAQVALDTITYDLTLPGNLKPYEQVKLFGKVDGFVANIKVDRGDYVKKGQLLMEIEALEIQQQYLAAQARVREILEKLQFSRQNYQRTKEAASIDGVVSQTELQQAQTRYLTDSASYQAVKAEVAVAEQLAKYTKITAPFDGVITKRFVSPGALVGVGNKPLLKLEQEKKLRLEVAVPSKHSKALQAGMKASFTVNSHPDKHFPIALSRSSQSFNPDLRAMIIEFDFDNSNGILSSGDYAEVDLHFKRRKPSLQVPGSSIITTTTDVYIAKVINEKIQLTPVITGMAKDGMIEIFGDVEAGDQIVVKGNSTLKDGLSIAF